MDTTVEKIRGFGKLKKGWHFGQEGIEFDTELLADAIELAEMLHGIGIDQTDAFPVPDGSVAVTGYKGDHYLEFTVEADTVTFVWE